MKIQMDNGLYMTLMKMDKRLILKTLKVIGKNLNLMIKGTKSIVKLLMVIGVKMNMILMVI